MSDTDDEDKRVIADVNRLLASFKIDQKEEERILEAFEKFNTQGLILVDGHHVHWPPVLCEAGAPAVIGR